jgi:predicted kinase
MNTQTCTKRKELWIVRGLPGSGKSTLLSQIHAVVFQTDEYHHTHEGYHFQATKILDAFQYTLQRVCKAMEEGVDCIAVEDAFTQKWEMKPFVLAAKKYFYQIHILEPTTDWWKERNVKELLQRNVHQVSQGTLERMIRNWEIVNDPEEVLDKHVPLLAFVIRGTESQRQDLLQKLKRFFPDFAFHIHECKTEDLFDELPTPLVLSGTFQTKKRVQPFVKAAIQFHYRVLFLEPEELGVDWESGFSIDAILNA